MRRRLRQALRTRLDPYIQARAAEGGDRALGRRVDALAAELSAISAQLAELRAIAAADHDRIPELRAALRVLRAKDEYAAVWDRGNPLITVRIATWNRAELLLSRTLPSVLAQTYQHFEIIVVGDHCTDDTEQRLIALGDDRIRFENLPYRSDYPDDPRARWMVAGGRGMNRANELASGDWIAPIDDDDSWTPEHLELLLGVALAGRHEVAYGKLRQRNALDGQVRDIYRYPPTHGTFGFQGALVLRQLTPVFEHDERSFVAGEPADWNLCRRMMLAGVRFGASEHVVGELLYVPPGEKPHDHP